MGNRVGLLHFRAAPVLGDELRDAIHRITGITLPAPVALPPLVPPLVPVPVPAPGAPPSSEPPPAPAPPPSPSPADGIPLQTRFGIAPQELADAIRRHWPASEWTSAAELSKLESGWSRTAINDTVSLYGPCGTRYYIARLGIWAQTEVSVGYYQINICAHGGDIALWSNTDANVRKAADLYRAAGDRYTPWIYSAGQLGLRT